MMGTPGPTKKRCDVALERHLVQMTTHIITCIHQVVAELLRLMKRERGVGGEGGIFLLLLLMLAVMCGLLDWILGSFTCCSGRSKPQLSGGLTRVQNQRFKVPFIFTD